ncbi:biliverdin-producing heme oxygenase [Hymenobacter weizhouensis]|uniref:biliverdin-producing heme oxygenase n=1 Tax=Hymenobacter sp. YIM 151500-1 TaxID=2987689 RepID=UPI002226896B|nr:biliverdin-producing heme oxygenase [Hymenobacter sp. YIM 151500-1]UYZ61559.1 biliverdin-producing heme oxygenase [Hymenobacter sp. YIM 151500-1]
MPSVVEAPSLLLRLRRETRPYHDALEQNAFNQALVAGAPTAEGTAWFLAKLYGFLQPYETALRQQVPAFSGAWELPARYRAHLILEDLQRPAAAPGLPLCPAMPPLHSRAQLLGAMYVVEGSTLGGQVITRQLIQAGIPLRRYFAGYGEQTGPRWKTFCQLLTAEAATTSPDDIVASASHTFQHLAAWIKQP